MIRARPFVALTGSTPRAHEVARGIEFEHGRRAAAAFADAQLERALVRVKGRRTAMDDPDVIALVHPDADRRPEQPVVRKRFGPQRIDFEDGGDNAAAAAFFRRRLLVEHALAGAERRESQHERAGDAKVALAPCRSSFPLRLRNALENEYTSRVPYMTIAAERRCLTVAAHAHDVGCMPPAVRRRRARHSGRCHGPGLHKARRRASSAPRARPAESDARRGLSAARRRLSRSCPCVAGAARSGGAVDRGQPSALRKRSPDRVPEHRRCAHLARNRQVVRDLRRRAGALEGAAAAERHRRVLGATVDGRADRVSDRLGAIGVLDPSPPRAARHPHDDSAALRAAERHGARLRVPRRRRG